MQIGPVDPVTICLKLKRRN